MNSGSVVSIGIQPDSMRASLAFSYAAHSSLARAACRIGSLMSVAIAPPPGTNSRAAKPTACTHPAPRECSGTGLSTVTRSL